MWQYRFHSADRICVLLMTLVHCALDVWSLACPFRVRSGGEPQVRQTALCQKRIHQYIKDSKASLGANLKNSG